MKAWGSLNSLGTDVQQSRPRDAGDREICDAGKPIAMIGPPSFPVSQLPSISHLLL